MEELTSPLAELLRSKELLPEDLDSEAFFLRLPLLLDLVSTLSLELADLLIFILPPFPTPLLDSDPDLRSDSGGAPLGLLADPVVGIVVDVLSAMRV